MNFPSINYKHEEWKYSPKKALETPLPFSQSSSLSDFKKELVGVGPSPDQIQSLSWGDLLEENYISIEEKTCTAGTGLDTKRAQKNSVLSDFYTNETALYITLKENIPSVLWIPLGHFKRPLVIEAQKYHTQDIILADLDAAEDTFFASSLISFVLPEQSNLNIGIHLSSAQKSFNQVNFDLHQESALNVYSLMCGLSSYKRLEVNAYQREAKSSITLNGGALVGDQSVFDYHSNVFHFAEEQQTKQIYKSLVQDKARSIFGGRIHLYEGSSEAQVEQLNNNLLLDQKSSVDSQPELNIYHDNVKASHGATTDTVDEEKLFYFLSRGLDPQKSKSLLLDAFLFSSLEDITSRDIKSFFRKNLSEALHGNDK